MKKLNKIIVTSLFLLPLGAFSYQGIKPSDLGVLQPSVEKFSSKESLDKHHQHLLDMANNANNSVVARYTYALLLGINHANDETRIMAIGALDNLLKDKKLSKQDIEYITDMRNLIIYQLQNKNLYK